MVDAGIISPAVSSWSFPVVIASEKNGTACLCVDYRTLNRKVEPYKWPLPCIEEVFNDPAGAQRFTTLDLFPGYWQMNFAEVVKETTTFICKYGTYHVANEFPFSIPA